MLVNLQNSIINPEQPFRIATFIQRNISRGVGLAPPVDKRGSVSTSFVWIVDADDGGTKPTFPPQMFHPPQAQ